MERSSLSGMSTVLPVIIIQARFSCGRLCGHSIRSFVRYAQPRVLKGGHNARPGTVAFYWLIGN